MSCAKLPGTLKGGCSLKRPFEKEAGESKGDGTPPLRTTSSGRAGRRPQRCGIPGAFPLGEKCGSIRCRENAVGVRFGAVKYGERRKLAILL